MTAAFRAVLDADRFGLAAIMIVAGASKFLSLNRFRESLERIEFIPTPIIALLAAATPSAEIGTGALLIVEPAIGGLLVTILLIAFIALAETMHRRGRRVPCACFGGIGEGILGRRTVLRNGVLVALAFLIVTFPPRWTGDSFPSALLGVAAASNIALIVGLYRPARRAPGEVTRLVAERDVGTA